MGTAKMGTEYWEMGTEYWEMGTEYWEMGTEYWEMGTEYWEMGTMRRVADVCFPLRKNRSPVAGI